MNKFVLVGAGSAQFGCDMLGDILVKEVFKGSHITLLDINSDALKKYSITLKNLLKIINWILLSMRH